MQADPADHGSPLLKKLLELQGEAVLATHLALGDATASIVPARLLDVMRCLRDTNGLDFEMLMDLTCVDHLGGPEPAPRFEMVYHLYSVARNHRLRIKARVEDPGEGVAPELDSLCELWPSADWMEREVWDLYGVRFRGHPNLRRLLLYEAFEGHPLRKDYPKTRRQPLVGPRERLG